MITLALGTGIDADARWRRGGGEPTNGLPLNGLPPLCLVPPTIAGPGWIGAGLRADPGIWQGATSFAFQWLRDGAALAGAGAPEFTPGPAEDGRRLQVLITATNAWGERQQLSENHFDITYEPPVAAATLPDVVLVQHSGEYSLDASSGFTGSSLTFGVSGEGVSIDPATGLLTILTDSLRDGVTVTVTAANSGGTAEHRFTLTVAAAEPAGTAPALIAAPALLGEGRIGTAVELEPGVWSGTPAPDLAYQWLLDENAIAGATGASYVPAPADDGRTLACQVTASNSAGSAEAFTAPLVVSYAPPVAAGALPDVVFAAGSGPQTVDAGADFTGDNLGFESTGAAIDAATGVVTIATEAPFPAAAVTVTASNSGGSATSGFTVAVVAVEPEMVPPALVAAPSIAGVPEIGGELTVAPGEWSGEPAPELAFQWRCDGKNVAGATGAGYAPQPADDGRALTCQVTATNPAGSAEAVTEPVTVRHAAPVLAGALADRDFVVGAGPQTVETAAAFAGAALVFSVAGAGVVIDPATGVLTIATDAPVAGETVTVTATNSGGSVSTGFKVTVAAAEAPEVPLKIGPANAALIVARDLDPETPGLHIGLKITAPGHPLHPSRAGVGHVAWVDGDPAGRDPVLQANKAVRAAGFADPTSPGYGVWALTRRPNGKTAGWADRSNEIGKTFIITVNWAADDPAVTPAAQAGWGGWGETFPALIIQEFEAGSPPPAAQAGEWAIEQVTVQA